MLMPTSFIDFFRPKNGEKTLEEIDDLIAEIRKRRLALARVRQRIRKDTRRVERTLEDRGGKPDGKDLGR